ncbi:diguanylate cyclase, partial [Pseudomonas coronafaciens]
MPNPPHTASSPGKPSHDDALRLLKETGDRLQLALDLAQMGTWDLDVVSNRMQASTQTAYLHGMGAQPFDDDAERFFSRLPTEERRRICDAYQAAVDNHDDYLQIIYRFQLIDGSSRLLESRARLYRDAQGQLSRLAGTL